jgi:hypothetical protein
MNIYIILKQYYSALRYLSSDFYLFVIFIYFTKFVTIQAYAGDSGNQRNEGAFSPEMKLIEAKGP